MFSEYHSVTIIQRITKKNFIFWKLTENNFLIAVCVYCVLCDKRDGNSWEKNYGAHRECSRS